MRKCRIGELHLSLPRGASLVLWLIACTIEHIFLTATSGDCSPTIDLHIENCTLGRASFFAVRFRELQIERSNFKGIVVDECAVVQALRLSDVSVQGPLLMRWSQIGKGCEVGFSKVLTEQTIVRMKDYLADGRALKRLHYYTRGSALSPFLRRSLRNDGPDLTDFFDFLQGAIFEDQRQKGRLWAEFLHGLCLILRSDREANQNIRLLTAFRLFFHRHFSSLMSPLSILAGLAAFVLLGAILEYAVRGTEGFSNRVAEALAWSSAMFHGSLPSAKMTLFETIVFMVWSFVGTVLLGFFVAAIIKRSTRPQ